ISGRRSRRLDRLHGSHSVLDHVSELPGIDAIWANTGVGAKRQLHASLERVPEVLPLGFAEIAIMLQEVGGHASFPTIFLNAFVVIDVHYQIGPALLREGYAFIVDKRRVLD